MATVNYASKYSALVDEAFALGSLTNAIINNNYDWTGVSTVNVYTIPTAALNNYSLTGTSRYGTPAELENSVQSMTVADDKSFTFTIDRKSEQDTVGTMEAGSALARQLEQVVIPYVDKYRIAKLVAGAGNTKTLAVTSSNAYEEFLAVQALIDEDLAPVGGRICLCTPAYYNLIKLDSSFTKSGDLATGIAFNGQVGEIDGVPTIKVPSSYFPENTDFIITNAIAMPAPVKLAEYKIHTDAPGISGSLVEGRIRQDAFVLTNKANAIGVHKNA